MGMFSNFVDDLNSAQANKGLLDYFLNQAFDDIPEGFGSYKKFSEDSYILSPNKDMQITFSFDELPNELKKKGIKNSEMLGKYLYSTQQSMSFDTVKISSDGYEIDPKKVILEPFENNPFPIKEVSKFFITPRKFPKPHPLEISFGEEKEIFHFERQPTEDFSKAWFKSIDNKPLTLSFLFDEETSKMNISIDFTIRKSNTIGEALKYSEYTDSFFQHDFSLFGEKIVDGNFSDEIVSQTPFLKLLTDIEQYLQDNLDKSFQFDPSVELSHDEYITAHKLYYSFILNKAFKTHNSIDSLTLQKDSVDPIFLEELMENINKGKDSGAFMSTRSEKIKLLGKEIDIDIVESFSMISMINITEVEDKIVVSVKQHEDSFSSSIYFLADEKSENQDSFDVLLDAEDIIFR